MNLPAKGFSAGVIKPATCGVRTQDVRPAEGRFSGGASLVADVSMEMITSTRMSGASVDRAAWPVVMVATVILASCGGTPPQSVPVGFVNHTHHSDAELQAIWATAQQSVAQSIDLNPLQQPQISVPPDLLPGDPRALKLMPEKLTVSAVRDVSSDLLFAATGTRRANPTGMIPCPKPCNVRYSTAYSSYEPPLTNYAASWEFEGDNFSVILEYEFENHILHTLGYKMTWR